MAIESVIFDKDGILVETERAHYESYRAAIWEVARLSLRKDAYIRYGASRDYREFFKDAFGEQLDISKYDAIRAKKHEWYDKFRQDGFKPVSGINELLKRLVGKYRLAITSTTALESIYSDLKNAGINKDYFELVKSAKESDIKRNKPYPDIYNRVAELMKVDASKCLVLEDAKNGIHSAKAAGMICIARSYEYTLGDTDQEKERYLLDARADKVIKSYSEITPQLIDSLSTTSVKPIIF